MESFESFLKKSLGDRFHYSVDAYQFVLDALDSTLKGLDHPRHITAAELLEGIRQFAIKCYGPMAKSVLEHWHVHECGDFGDIVFQLVDAKLVSKQNSDNIEDFQKGYDFTEVF